MSDRELLELAAKAGGVSGPWIERCPKEGYPTFTCGIGLAHWNRIWNPLTDDGDALRLAVKCNLSLMRVGTYPAAVINDAKLRDTTYYSEDCIRRAIVAAAAEIGKSLA